MTFKKLSLIPLLLLFFTCSDPGTTETLLDGETLQNLPENLKGLKVYNVSLGEGSSIMVAVLEGKMNSIQYKSGKFSKDVIILEDSWDSSEKREIPVKKIVMENDSIIVAEK